MFNSYVQLPGGFINSKMRIFPLKNVGFPLTKSTRTSLGLPPHFSEPGQEMRQMVEDLCAEVARSAPLEDVVQRMDNQWITNG